MDCVMPAPGINVACSGKQFHGTWNCDEPVVLGRGTAELCEQESNALLLKRLSWYVSTVVHIAMHMRWWLSYGWLKFCSSLM